MSNKLLITYSTLICIILEVFLTKLKDIADVPSQQSILSSQNFDQVSTLLLLHVLFGCVNKYHEAIQHQYLIPPIGHTCDWKLDAVLPVQKTVVKVRKLDQAHTTCSSNLIIMQ